MSFIGALDKIGDFFKKLFTSQTVEEVVTLGATIAETFLPSFTPLIQSIVTEYAKAAQLANSVGEANGSAAQIALIVQGVQSEYQTFAAANKLTPEPAQLQSLVQMVISWLETQKPAA